MLFFLSKHYFTSRNCLREVKASIDEQRPLVLVHEQQQEKGGGPLETMRMECREEMRSYVFDGRTPITWHRIAHYQNLTLKLIATEMLRHGPKYNNSSSQLAHFIATAHHQRNSSTREELTPSERMSRRSSWVEWLGLQEAKAPAVQEQETAAAVKVQAVHRGSSARQMSLGALLPSKELSLVLPGEVNIAQLALPRPLVLWCSAGNPGAAAMAHELKDALAGGGDAIHVVERRPDARQLEAQGKSVAMLLYLNKDTWATQPGVLEHDVRATYSFAHGLGAGLVRIASNMRELRRMGSSLDERGAGSASADKIQIVLVHEADPAKGGCEFGTFFGTTPPGADRRGHLQGYRDRAPHAAAPRGQPRPRGASPGRDQGRREAGEAGAPRQPQQVIVIVGQQWRGRRGQAGGAAAGVRVGRDASKSWCWAGCQGWLGTS